MMGRIQLGVSLTHITSSALAVESLERYSTGTILSNSESLLLANF